MEKSVLRALAGKAFSVAMMAVAIATIATSCKDKEEAPFLRATATTAAATVKPAGDTTSVLVESNNLWTINSDKAWVHFDKQSGTNGSTRVKITVDANPAFVDREATVTILSGELKQQVTVKQLKLEKFITLSKAEFKSDGVTPFMENLVITANVTYTLNKAQFPAWLTVDETTTKGTFKVSIAPNDEVPIERSFDVVVADAEGFQKTFKVTQGPRGAFIEIGMMDRNIEMPSSTFEGSLTKEITLKSSGELMYTQQGWGMPTDALAATLTSTKGTDGIYTTKVKFALKPHIGPDTFQWYFLFQIKGKEGENDPWARTGVTQYPQYLPMEMPFTAAGGSQVFDIDLTGWSAAQFAGTVSAGTESWLSVVKNATTGKWQVVAQPNTGAARTGYVSFSIMAGEFYNEWSVAIKQDAAN